MTCTARSACAEGDGSAFGELPLGGGEGRLLGGLLIVKVPHHINQGLSAAERELSPQLGQILLAPRHTDHRRASV